MDSTQVETSGKRIKIETDEPSGLFVTEGNASPSTLNHRYVFLTVKHAAAVTGTFVLHESLIRQIPYYSRLFDSELTKSPVAAVIRIEDTIKRNPEAMQAVIDFLLTGRCAFLIDHAAERHHSRGERYLNFVRFYSLAIQLEVDALTSAVHRWLATTKFDPAKFLALAEVCTGQRDEAIKKIVPRLLTTMIRANIAVFAQKEARTRLMAAGSVVKDCLVEVLSEQYLAAASS